MTGSPPATSSPCDPIAAYRSMEERVAAGNPPSADDLLTPWEQYRAAVLLAGPDNTVRLPSDLVADLRADHEALIRVARRRSAHGPGPGPGPGPGGTFAGDSGRP